MEAVKDSDLHVLVLVNTPFGVARSDLSERLVLVSLLLLVLHVDHVNRCQLVLVHVRLHLRSHLLKLYQG